MEPSGLSLPEEAPALARLLEERGSTVRLKRGETLFHEGEDGDAVFRLVEGRLEVSVLSVEGRKLVLDISRPGALLGEIALFDPGPRSATLTALEPVVLRRLHNSELKAAIARDPDIAIELISIAGRRMRWMNHQLGDQVFLPLPSRLARRILYLTDEASGDLKMNQSQLAGFVGATREGVSNILREWKQAGILDLTRGGLKILNRRALEDVTQVDV